MRADPSSVGFQKTAGDVEAQAEAPSIVSSGLRETVEDGFKRGLGNAAAVSTTETWTSSPSRSPHSRMLPPGGVNLSELAMRLLSRMVGRRGRGLFGKALRRHQGKSPGSYGVSQARGLLGCGFPYVAVAHLIVSDSSPKESWREVAITRLLDESGRCEPLRNVKAGMMPADLIRRSFGRLSAMENTGPIGLWLPMSPSEALGIQKAEDPF